MGQVENDRFRNVLALRSMCNLFIVVFTFLICYDNSDYLTVSVLGWVSYRQTYIVFIIQASYFIAASDLRRRHRTNAFIVVA